MNLDSPVGRVRVGRHRGGVPGVAAAGWPGAFFGLGYLHGRHRGAQIALLRWLGQGRLNEHLSGDSALLALDRHYRRLGFARDAEAHVGALEAPYAEHLAAYTAGVNAAWRRPPWLLRTLGARPEPYRAADVLLTLKVMAFAGLAEGQRMAELFLVHCLRRGLDAARLRALLPAVDARAAAWVADLAALPPFHPGGPPPAAGGSNAWALAGHLSASGAPLLANDPHLEVNRLPPVLYEVRLDVGERWAKGATVPGAPGVLPGRTPELAWGITYSCADTSDFYVELCEGGRRRAPQGWQAFDTRRERILRRHDAAEELTVHEGPHGVLEGDATRPGRYLSWRWTGMGAAGLGAIRGFIDLLECRSVGQARAALQQVEIPTLHVVLADRAGNIGYQLTGAIPRRPAGWSGLTPAPGWEPGWEWQGLRDPARELPGLENPPEGFIATANEARPARDGTTLINLPLAPYRRERIVEWLSTGGPFDVAAMQALQGDLRSLEARAVAGAYLPFVTDARARTTLAAWDGCYDADSEGATLFEAIHRAAVIEVFGAALGRDWLAEVLERTSLRPILAGCFDAVIARADPAWLPPGRRAALLGEGVQRGLAAPAGPWGTQRPLTLRHVVLGGRFPAWLGIDRGPYPSPGNHATVCQGAAVDAGGRAIRIAAVYRLVTDMGGETVWSALPGGRAETPFFPGYATDLRRWRRGRCKRF